MSTNNETIDLMLNHKSVRKFKKECPTDEMVETIVTAGQQAAFAYQQYSILLTRKGNIPFNAPLLFTICVDVHKFRLIMEKRGRKLTQNDISLLLFGLQDGSLAVQNMVLAAESMGLGTCLLGNTPYVAANIKEKYQLPDKVFPFVQMAVGYPDDENPVRPRYPLEYSLFEDRYPDFSDTMVERAIDQMDAGYLEQDYYRKADCLIKLPDNMKEEYNFDNYSWTEHISRKCTLWWEDSDIIKKQMKKCGFDIDK